MFRAVRIVSHCFLAVAVSCVSAPLQATEPEVPVNKRLREIIAWTAADTDAATGLVIDCLSDERTIQGDTLQGQSKEIWTDLRSSTNVEITVSRFALHHLCRSNRSKDLLAKRIHDLHRESKADPADDWLPADGGPVLQLLQALTEVHQRALWRQDIIPETQVIMVLKSKSAKEVVGVEVVTESSATIIAGYVDHRDKSFSKYVSGKVKSGSGQVDQIEVTRRNLLSVTDAVRDSDVKKGSQ